MLDGGLDGGVGVDGAAGGVFNIQRSLSLLWLPSG